MYLISGDGSSGDDRTDRTSGNYGKNSLMGSIFQCVILVDPCHFS